MKFRKRPIVVEAWQLTSKNRASNVGWPQWLHDAWNLPDGAPGRVFPFEAAPAMLAVSTLEGIMQVSLGDWIIQGVKGELYPCKPDIFEATYEIAE